MTPVRTALQQEESAAHETHLFHQAVQHGSSHGRVGHGLALHGGREHTSGSVGGEGQRRTENSGSCDCCDSPLLDIIEPCEGREKSVRRGTAASRCRA